MAAALDAAAQQWLQFGSAAGSDVDRLSLKSIEPEFCINPTTNQEMMHSARQRVQTALDALPPVEPVSTVSYRSQGRLLVLANSSIFLLEALSNFREALAPSLLWCGSDQLPTGLPSDLEIVQGEFVALTGFLGAFSLEWRPSSGSLSGATFDLVLDLREQPAFPMHQPPQGYFHAHDDPSLKLALDELPEMVGEFEKPKFFAYKASICAHSRSKKEGCNRCIDICSTKAISSAGDTVTVDPYLCMGCGACATVCPSGAMSYQYPRVDDRGAQLRAALSAYRAGVESRAAVVLFYSQHDSRFASISDALPSHVLAIPGWHVAAVGLDVMLGAFAYGAAGVAVIGQAADAPQYVDATRREMQTGQTILNALGFSGEHFQFAREFEAINLEAFPAKAAVQPAGFHLSNDKRATLT